MERLRLVFCLLATLPLCLGGALGTWVCVHPCGQVDLASGCHEVGIGGEPGSGAPAVVHGHAHPTGAHSCHDHGGHRGPSEHGAPHFAAASAEAPETHLGPADAHPCVDVAIDPFFSVTPERSARGIASASIAVAIVDRAIAVAPATASAQPRERERPPASPVYLRCCVLRL